MDIKTITNVVIQLGLSQTAQYLSRISLYLRCLCPAPAFVQSTPSSEHTVFFIQLYTESPLPPLLVYVHTQYFLEFFPK